MIRIIITDVDGTLIPEGQSELQPGLLEAVHELQARGFLFAVASGRSYYSLRTLFAPVAEKLYFICETGNVLFDGYGNLIGKTPLPHETAEQICRMTRQNPKTKLVLGAPHGIYIYPFEGEFLHLMRDIKKNRVEPYDPSAAVPEDICKISVYCPEGFEQYWQAVQAADFGCNCVISAPDWVDLSLGDKRSGIQSVLSLLDIPQENLMYFGDTFSDVDALRLAGYPWLIDSAAPELKAEFPHHTNSVRDVLQRIVAELDDPTMERTVL